MMVGEVVSHLMEKLPADYLRVRRSEEDVEEWYRLPAPAGRLIAEFEARVYAVFDFEDRDLVLETILEGKGSW